MPHLMHAHYDAGLVAVSVAVAILASYVALDLTARLNAARLVPGSGWEQALWGLGGAIAMGTGIWSMHFIAMLALQLSSPIRYGLGLLIVSVLPAIGASGLALYISSRPRVSQAGVLAGGLCMGVGIAAMHYTGMAAIVSPVGVHYHAGLWWLSVAIAIVASCVALTLAFALRGHAGLWMPTRALAAIVMGVAIAGMHYTGMAAARFPAVPEAVTPPPVAGVLASRGLAIAVMLAAFAILGLALTSAAVSIRLGRREEARQRDFDTRMRLQEDARRVRTEQTLRDAAEALAATGPAFFESALAELMRVLDARLGLIASIDEGTARTIVLMRDGAIVPNITLPLDGSPLSRLTLGNGLDCIAEGAARQFTGAWLAGIDVNGYIGMPIRDPERQVVGMIALFTERPLHDRGEAEALLQIFGTRVAGEMTQLRTEAALRRSEHRIFQIEKMEAIGQLAGGVAHDFNNMLTVILGYGQELLEHYGADGEAATHLREMMDAADRARQLTQQLLAFSRKQVLQPRAVSLDDMVASVESMLRRIIGEDIRFITRPRAGGATIHADPSQLSQVLLNLAVNARDAMPDGGTLSIETDRVQLRRVLELDGGRSVPPGQYVRLVVRDTGHGMDEATLARIFEPFFSTKGASGTGLGLATVYGIVRQSEGFIHCQSRVDGGTTFTIHFPESDRPASTANTAEETRAPRQQHGEAILVVEDEDAVRHFLVSSLARRGYLTRGVASAAEGLELLRGGFTPDLMLTDFVLPGGMNGGELAAIAAESCPDLRIILMSGYAKEPIPGDGRLPVHAFLHKPFTPDILAARIREILGDDGVAGV